MSIIMDLPTVSKISQKHIQLSGEILKKKKTQRCKVNFGILCTLLKMSINYNSQISNTLQVREFFK